MALVAPAMDAHLAGGKPRAHMRNLSVSSSNALENFGHFEDVVQSKRVVVLLDYDGTLTPIVSDPSQVRTKLRSIQCVCSRQGGAARNSRLSEGTCLIRPVGIVPCVLLPGLAVGPHPGCAH